MEKKSTLSTLISVFSFARSQARKNAEKKLWDRNKLSNPTKRGGYDVRETTTNIGGKTIIIQQLWKKIDEVRTEIVADISVTEIDTTKNEVEDLLS
jgi:hypothetical protein